MEKFSFFAASAALCLFLTVAISSAMTNDCLCDGLPGSQCDYCEHVQDAPSSAFSASSGLEGQYYAAWEQEHEDFHHGWVELHEAFHAESHTDDEHRDFHKRMDGAHGQFHGILNAR